MKMCGGVEFFTSALDGGEWSASYPGRFTPGTHGIGGWLGPRAGLNSVDMRKTFCSAGERTPAVQPVARRYIDWAMEDSTTYIPALICSHPSVLPQVTTSKPWARFWCNSARYTYTEPCHTSGSWTLASHPGASDSVQGDLMWGSWWSKCPSCFCFPLLIIILPLHHFHLLALLSCTIVLTRQHIVISSVLKLGLRLWCGT
jgi:hypothetical protein